MKSSATSETVQRRDFDDLSYVEYYEAFFDQCSSERFLNHFLSEDFPWERQAIRGVVIRRANAWFANDPSHVYRYSGQVWQPRVLTPVVSEICASVEKLCNSGLNSALAAFYPDGKTAVGWHDDNDFPDLPDTPIVSVSFGAERTFKIRRKSDHEIVAEYNITNGSVIIMGGALQRCFDHSIQKTAKKVGPRVNLSFRTFRHAN